MEGDVIYFSRRANGERTAAMRAANPNARRSHLDMAARYDELVFTPTRNPPSSMPCLTINVRILRAAPSVI